MTPALFQRLFDYHYARLRAVWESIMQLSEAQFVQEVAYSHGSLRNQIVHLIDDDLSWILRIEGKQHQPLNADDLISRDAVFAEFVKIESYVATFIATLDEVTLNKNLVWQPPMTMHSHTVSGREILLHVINHGTDHRAQILRILHDLGAPTFDQDYMGYLVQKTALPTRQADS